MPALPPVESCEAAGEVLWCVQFPEAGEPQTLTTGLPWPSGWLCLREGQAERSDVVQFAATALLLFAFVLLLALAGPLKRRIERRYRRAPPVRPRDRARQRTTSIARSPRR